MEQAARGVPHDGGAAGSAGHDVHVSRATRYGSLVHGGNSRYKRGVQHVHSKMQLINP